MMQMIIVYILTKIISQILGKMNRKILEESMPPMFSQCLSFSTATDYKYSEDKPENPFKIILK